MVIQKNGMIRKLSLTGKFITSQARQRIITIQILPNISRREDNNAMKFGQLIDYNMIFFLEKSYRKCGEKLVPDLFIKNSKMKFCAVCFIVCPSWWLPKYIETKIYWNKGANHLLLPFIKPF